MPFFIVTKTHPDGDGWGREAGAHVDDLKTLVAEGTLKASAPFKGTPKRAGFLIFAATDRAEVDRLVEGDPFAIHDLIESLSVAEGDPLFGAFASESSGTLPGIGRVET